MGAKLKKLKSHSKAKVGGSATEESKAKKLRGPKPYIDDAANPADDHTADDEDALQRALDAEEMAASFVDDSASEGSSGSPRPSSKGKAKASDADLAFLLNLDQKGMSRSRAEEARLKKAERKAQHEEVNGAKGGRSQEVNDDSDGESTDMEGASEGSDSDSEAGFSGFDSLEEDFDSAASMSGESSLDSDLDDDNKAELAEQAHEDRLTARKRRQDMEEAAQAQTSKRQRLPVRGDKGTWKQDSEDESAEEADQGSPAKAQKSRALHSLKVAEARRAEEEEEERQAAAESSKRQRAAEPVSTILSGTRFGLQAPYSIMLQKPKSARVAAAREQIARLSTDIIGDPEVSLGLLRRLSVFAQPTISRPDHDSMAREKNAPAHVTVDESIRAAALMSLTAVYIDILPGYRIRPLTDKEKTEKVNQETSRRREWEQGLVEVYKSHLQNCEQVARAKTSISPVALRSMCVLLTRATHFNFRTNLIGSLVSQLSRRGWNGDSQLCAESLTEVLRRDLSGETSLEVVRLLNRMIKERAYQINAKVLNLLLHLRLKDELGAKRADTVRADKSERTDGDSKGKRFQSGKGKAKPKDVRKGQGQHLSKKQVKKMREIKEVEKDMREAEAEVDQEERERNHTETLKLLFVLYFSILKADSAPGSLLGAALEGLAKFAHRVNLDFFRDLLAVLREHVKTARAAGLSRSTAHLADEDDEEEEDEEEEGTLTLEAEARRQDNLRKALLCLVTAFELLQGQGEALNIDLSDMVAHLYAIVLPLCSSPSLEEVPSDDSSASRKRQFQSSTHLLRTDADLLLRALDLCLLRPRLSELPSERSAAFARRLLVGCLSTPASTALRLLGVVRVMIAKDTRLEALVDTEDRARNGKFDLASDNLELARPLAAGDVAWELHLLARHVNEDVATAAENILACRGP
ncbi:unnamed protein product [Parajaminaea phylloscopi]